MGKDTDARSCDFNSIKVQLKPFMVILMPFTSIFQFHKGTIKTKVRLSVLVLDTLFQFHKGTIKTKDYLDDIVNNGISIP